MNSTIEITSTEKVIEGVGRCRVYGMILTDEMSETAVAEDVSPDRDFVERLAKRFADAGLYAAHLRDAVIDAIS